MGFNNIVRTLLVGHRPLFSPGLVANQGARFSIGNRASAAHARAAVQTQIDRSSMNSPFSSGAEGNTMARTFNQMAEEAMAEVPVINAEEAHQRIEEDSETLVIDPRDAADVAATGMVAGAINISFGALTYQADNELPEDWRNPVFENRSRPIITACEMGPLGALAGKLLKDMGFTNVSILDGGLEAWKKAGYPTS